jgi:transposase
MSSTQLHQVYFNPKQLKLPLSFEILIPFDSEVRTFDEVFRRINFKKYLVAGKNKGRSPYNPINMLKLILFCHMEKITSLREMEKAAKNDVRLMWLTDEMKPSHQAIKNFMDAQLKASITTIFQAINQELIKIEQINTHILYVDGTKIEANANKYTFVWKGSVQKFQEKLYRKIDKLMVNLNQRYNLEGLYFELATTYEVDALECIKRFIETEIEKEAISFVYGKGTRKKPLQRDYELLTDYIEKLRSYQEHLEIMGSHRNSYAKTDHDATFMHMKEDHMRNGQLKAGYNVQIGVSDEYILHLDIFQDRSDYHTFIPFLNSYHESMGGYPKYPVADAGYGGLKNYRFLKENGLELYQKYSMYSKDTADQKYINNPFRAENYQKDKQGNYICPKGRQMIYLFQRRNGKKIYECQSCKRCPLANQCKKGKKAKRIEVNEELWAYQKEVRENLKSELGIELRIQRSIQVEGAFGVIKEAFKFRRFKYRTMKNVKFEFILIAIGYNFAKYHKKKYRLIE